MTITDYLAELERELRRRRAPRVRVLREVEDHLRDLSAELVADGYALDRAEARAVSQFGAAATVAARFAEATASTTAHRGVTIAAAALVAYAGVFVAFATAASPLLHDFPQGAASFFGLQLAAVALLVAAVRSLRWRGVAAAPAAELKAIAGGLSVACLALIGTAIAEGAVALSRPAGVIVWSDGRWLTLAFATAVGVLLLSTLSAARAGAQARAVAVLPSVRTHSTAAALLIDDVDALLGRASLSRAGRALRALLAHSWAVTFTLAAFAFVAVSLGGLADSGHAGLAGAAVLGGLEASLILVSFLALGRTLGLRDAPRRV
jgi:hypothetical protein